jgi:hypothetical protein
MDKDVCSHAWRRMCGNTHTYMVRILVWRRMCVHRLTYMQAVSFMIVLKYMDTQSLSYRCLPKVNNTTPRKTYQPT